MLWAVLVLVAWAACWVLGYGMWCAHWDWAAATRYKHISDSRIARADMLFGAMLALSPAMIIVMAFRRLSDQPQFFRWNVRPSPQHGGPAR